MSVRNRNESWNGKRKKTMKLKVERKIKYKRICNKINKYSRMKNINV